MPTQHTDSTHDSPTQPIDREKLQKAGANAIDAEDNAYKGGDQDIDTAGTDADDQSPTKALQNPKEDRQDRNVEEPGDTDSADIVDRTGEQMPRQSHDGLPTVAVAEVGVESNEVG